MNPFDSLPDILLGMMLGAGLTFGWGAFLALRPSSKKSPREKRRL